MMILINGVNPINEVTEVVRFVSHPGTELWNFTTTFFTECFETISLVSFDWLLIGGLLGLILYVFGWEKGKNWGLMCPAIYMIIQIISKVLICIQ